uniref:GNAT family N-acetyltransferase n=1 Tax=Planococcus sp. CAU13 TaxID=1541197 RepID=UPI00052FDE01
VIANASVNKMTVISNGKEYRAIQVGTVMTHPDYRNQGLAAELMNKIIETYEKEYDFIYLFANKTVLDFYPKFGFEKVKESRFSMKAYHLEKVTDNTSSLRKLDINNQTDFQLMKEFAIERVPVSSILGVKNSEHLLMFYFIIVFKNSIYYDEEENVIIIFEVEDDKLHVFDIISKARVEADRVLSRIVSADIDIIYFYFIPDLYSEDVDAVYMEESNDVLFVRPLLLNDTGHLAFPLTSHS